jgi:hypothetical protein
MKTLHRVHPLAPWLLALLLAPVVVLAGRKPKEWTPDIRPGDFVATVDNRWFPLTPGRTYRYENRSRGETLTIEVTTRRKTVMGVSTTVVLETGTEDGQLVEVSENWFAQDRDGNVWYFGEQTQDYVNGAPAGTEGSWEAGVGGAVPGIIMLAEPERGDTYFQEHAPGIAEDQASVLDLSRSVSTPHGSYTDVLRTKEWTALEPNSVEHKYYAPGVGLVLEEKGGERLELVAVE